MVRSWFQDIKLTLDRVGPLHIGDVISRTITGSLHSEVERFIRERLPAHGNIGNQIPWVDIKAQITRGFLHVDDTAALRDEVAHTKQSVYAFSHRFRQITDVAYPPPARNVDQHRMILTAFLRALTRDAFTRKLVAEVHPVTLDEAITSLEVLSEREDEYTRVGRTNAPEVQDIQPMEIDYTQCASALSSTDELLHKVISSQEKLTTKVAKIEMPDKYMSAIK